tara:strand:- start:331 stop:552 length:222 start_codon:yes stop_codon:yes gene_type:complete
MEDDFQKEQAMKDIYMKNITIQRINTELEVLKKMSRQNRRHLKIAIEGLQQIAEYGDVGIATQTLKEISKDYP